MVRWEIFSNIVNHPLKDSFRTVMATITAPIVFGLGLMKYHKNELFMPFWRRDFSSLWHGFTGFGHTDVIVMSLPTGAVGLIAALVVAFLVFKSLVKYPAHLNIHYILLVIMDYLVVATLVNIFIFSGTAFEVFYYGGAFLAGALVFGDRITSQLALLGLIVMIFIRLINVDGLYPYVFVIPMLGLVYVLLRAPFESEVYTEEMKDFSLTKMIGKES